MLKFLAQMGCLCLDQHSRLLRTFAPLGLHSNQISLCTPMLVVLTTTI